MHPSFSQILLHGKYNIKKVNLKNDNTKNEKRYITYKELWELPPNQEKI